MIKPKTHCFYLKQFSYLNFSYRKVYYKSITSLGLNAADCSYCELVREKLVRAVSADFIWLKVESSLINQISLFCDWNKNSEVS